MCLITLQSVMNFAMCLTKILLYKNPTASATLQRPSLECCILVDFTDLMCYLLFNTFFPWLCWYLVQE